MQKHILILSSTLKNVLKVLQNPYDSKGKSQTPLLRGVRGCVKNVTNYLKFASIINFQKNFSAFFLDYRFHGNDIANHVIPAKAGIHFFDNIPNKNLKIIIEAFLIFLIIQLNAYAGDLVINEIFYDPGDTGLGCFVELYGKPDLKLDGYRLTGINGNGGGEYNVIDLSGQKVPSTGYFVVGEDKSVPNANVINTKADYQNGPDSIELWNKEGKLDAVGYGDFTKDIFKGEGTPTLDLSGHSIGRRPDGFDTNDNSVDFVGLAIPSPGKSNMPAIAAIEKKGKLTQTWASIKQK